LSYVSLGEVLIQLNSVTPGPLRHTKYLEVHVAGAEANVMVGLSRLGLETGLVTKVGCDEFGNLIISTLRGERVDISRVKVDPNAPTGLYFIQRHYPVPRKSTVLYYRRGSAASKMSPEDVEADYLSRFNHLLLTGITPALSPSCADAVSKSYEIAKRRGLEVIFDTNIRMKLWNSLEEARKTISEYLQSKIVFTNEEDLNILYPGSEMISAAHRIAEKGAEIVVVKMGAKGALAIVGNRVFKKEAFQICQVEDVIGAGDAFNAAFLASILEGYSVEEALENGNAAGALVVTVRGDIEALPTWNDLKTFIESTKKALLLR